MSDEKKLVLQSWCHTTKVLITPEQMALINKSIEGYFDYLKIDLKEGEKDE